MFPKKVKKNLIIKVILLFIGISVLISLIEKIGLNNFFTTIKEANQKLIILGICFYSIALIIRCFKWYILFIYKNKKISFLKFAPIFFINSFLSNITPGKSGELATPILFKKYFKSSIGEGLSIVIFDRFIEIFSLTFLIAFSFYSLNISIKNDYNPLFFGLAVIFFIIIFLLFILFVQSKNNNIALKIEKLKFFKNIFNNNNFLSNEILKFRKNCCVFLYEKKIFVLLLILSFLAWFFETLSFYMIVRSVFEANFFVIAKLQLIAIGITIVSFIPAGLGVGNISFAYLASINGFQYEQAGIASLLATLFFLGSIIIYGNISLFALRRIQTKI